MRRGFSLVELAVGLFLLTLATSALLPAARRQADRMAVLAAREASASLLLRVRTEAVRRRGASLRFSEEASWLTLVAEDDTLATLSLEGAYGVQLELGGAREVELAFDGLGIGRVASRSLRFLRGDAEAALIVSGYGRVTRR